MRGARRTRRRIIAPSYYPISGIFFIGFLPQTRRQRRRDETRVIHSSDHHRFYIRARRPLPRGEKRLLGLCGACVSVCVCARRPRACVFKVEVGLKQTADDVRVVRSYVVGIGTRKIINVISFLFVTHSGGQFSRGERIRKWIDFSRRDMKQDTYTYQISDFSLRCARSTS